MAIMRQDSGIVLIQEEVDRGHKKHQPSPDGQEADADLCFWWRRGRVELPVQKTPRPRYTTGLAGH